MKKVGLFFLFTGLSIICYSNLLGYLQKKQKNDENKVDVVVIDPGHGGKDLGATADNKYEKDITLAISLKLGQKIKTAFPDIKIIYTRTTDEFIPVYERAEIANENKADLFISIHVNSVEQTYVKGAETYVLGPYQSEENLDVARKENAVILLEDNYVTTYEGFDPKSPESYIIFELVQDEYLEQSVLFASDIQDQFRETANRLDRSVRQAGFMVLRRIAMPGVLIETGFISNREERGYMFSEAGQNELSDAIYNAFSTYKRRIENKSKFTLLAQVNSPSESDSTSTNEKTQLKSETPLKNITYSVQLSASTRKLKPTSVNFKGVKNVFRKNYGNSYKYFTGSYHSYEEAQNEKQLVLKKFPDAFIVAFQNEELISVKMALEN